MLVVSSFFPKNAGSFVLVAKYRKRRSYGAAFSITRLSVPISVKLMIVMPVELSFDPFGIKRLDLTLC
jgi:hypothetical protein